MIRNKLLYIFITMLFVWMVSSLMGPEIFAEDPTTTPSPTPTPEDPNDPSKIQRSQKLQKEIEELSQKLTNTRNEKTSLTNQITYMDTQIAIAQLEIQRSTVRIAEMKIEIEKFADKILTLEGSLDDISEIFIDRVVATYKTGQIPTMLLLANSNGATDLIARTTYLKRIQVHDKKLMYAVQSTKTDFEDQKVLLEDKREELAELNIQLEQQSAALDQQKVDKERLLEITKNDEKTYQNLLASAQAEYEAIQAIVAGYGEEAEIGPVNEGDRIASIIQGSSCNSNGAHLHFIVSNNGITSNPFNYLQSDIDFDNCSGPGVCSEADPFNPNGSWRWPLNPKVRLTQGYGTTWAVQHNPWVWYSSHNGIDINSLSSAEVKAVRSGTLYRGTYNEGCPLRYVRVDHDDSDMDTLYLHINY